MSAKNAISMQMKKIKTRLRQKTRTNPYKNKAMQRDAIVVNAQQEGMDESVIKRHQEQI